MRVVATDGSLYVRDFQSPVLGVADRVVGNPHQGGSPRALVLKDVRLVSEDELVSSTAVRAHGNQVPHRAADVRDNFDNSGFGGWFAGTSGRGAGNKN